MKLNTRLCAKTLFFKIVKQLFPDHGAFVKEENRRWELTTNHWDLPIHVVNADAAD